MGVTLVDDMVTLFGDRDGQRRALRRYSDQQVELETWAEA